MGRKETAAIRSYQDLEVWQKAMELVEDCYRLTSGFPKEEVYGLSSQLQRSAVSVAANIAEGRERGSTREFLRHLSIAGGSLAELETHILIGQRLDYINEASGNELMDKTARIGRMLNGLRRSLQQRTRSPAPSPRPPVPVRR
jgi:four helix bundle protein